MEEIDRNGSIVYNYTNAQEYIFLIIETEERIHDE